ncbi:prepilin peptidase [Streptomyces sp. Ru73]|uniref:prepilin peptidase n=1 Tax=Streptomyces sp. Ru73 TaxID=2080748 RepID=UPI000CDDE85E|nr:A24 family peptidase [Streptomyces sp. Ru73]POX41674.1 prepilin peptidase [Streptomyces sp. Ru73]
MHPLLTVLAAGYGAAAGLLVPRAAYRLAVEPEEDRRATCPRGHLITGPARGWLGLARCPDGAGVPRGAEAALAAADGATPGTVPVPAPPVPAPCRAYGPARTAAPLVTAVACALLAAAAGPRPELAVWLLLAPVAVLLATVDAAVHRLPDVLTLPAAGAVAALLGAAALLPGHRGSWTGALLGGAALTAGYFVLFLIRPDGLGFGDVKLALTLGVVLGWYGWGVLFLGAFAGFLLGSVYGVGMIIVRRAGRKSALPFGPFMALGALLGLLLGAYGAG